MTPPPNTTAAPSAQTPQTNPTPAQSSPVSTAGKKASGRRLTLIVLALLIAIYGVYIASQTYGARQGHTTGEPLGLASLALDAAVEPWAWLVRRPETASTFDRGDVSGGSSASGNGQLLSKSDQPEPGSLTVAAPMETPTEVPTATPQPERVTEFAGQQPTEFPSHTPPPTPHPYAYYQPSRNGSPSGDRKSTPYQATYFRCPNQTCDDDKATPVHIESWSWGRRTGAGSMCPALSLGL